MNFPTPWFKNSWLKTQGLKSQGLKSQWLKGPGLKLWVEKSGVEMSFNPLKAAISLNQKMNCEEMKIHMEIRGMLRSRSSMN